MQINNNYKVKMVGLILGLIQLSCSTGKEINEDYYLNKEFIGKEFNNVSLGVLTEDIDPDTINYHDIQTEYLSRFYFLKDFREQFPVGMTYYSNFDNVQWVFYNPMDFNNSKEYSYLDEKGIEKYFDLPNSMEHLKKENNFDYLMYFESLTIYQRDNSKKSDLKSGDKKYNIALTAKYIIWDNQNLTLVTRNQIYITSEFDNLFERWSFKNTIMKLSSMIIDDLPMFKR